MSKQNLGRVSIAPKGTWDVSTAYKKLDVVNNNGASWLAMQDNTGVTPAEGESWMNLIGITKEGVIDALGYTPMNSEWELLNTTTLEEIVSWIVINKDADGNPLKLSRMLAILDFPSSSYVDQSYIGVDRFKWLAFNGGATYMSFVFYAEFIQNGIARGYWSRSKFGSTVQTCDNGQSIQTTGIRALSTNYISSFVFYANQTDFSPVGTTIKLYGVRA